MSALERRTTARLVLLLVPLSIASFYGAFDLCVFVAFLMALVVLHHFHEVALQIILSDYQETNRR